MLDVGASIGADAEHLVDLAAHGQRHGARVLLGLERPTVGLLNIGVEEVKGLEEVREAGRILRERPLPDLDYVGFVEGDDIGTGKVDVVVTEGFAGNIALKTAEGTARQIGGYLRAANAKLARQPHRLSVRRAAFDKLRERLDPRRANGGVFLGLNGIVIKSHGGTDAEGFAPPSSSATMWCATSCWPRSRRRLDGAGRRAATGADRSRFVTVRRSVVLGCGSYLPNQVLTNADLARKSTPPTSGSSSAPEFTSGASPRPANSPRTWLCTQPAQRSRTPISMRKAST